ncbi:MAG: MFS transporter, partial [Myxococcota bacterium]
MKLKGRTPLILRDRQRALLVLCMGALMVILDASVTTVVLPMVMRDLGMTLAGASMLIGAELIPFGCLLLAAARLGQFYGPKRQFITGLLLYSVAAAACGVVATPSMMVAARCVLGIGGALMGGVTFGMLTTMFPGRREQVISVGLFGLVSSVGPLVGLLASAAVATEFGWRPAYLIVALAGLPAILAAWHLLPKDEFGEEASTIDSDVQLSIVMSIFSAAALLALVQALVWSVDGSWTTAVPLLSAGAILGAVMAIRLGLRAADPTETSHPPIDRNIVWSNVALALMAVGSTSMLLLGSLYTQNILGFSPLSFALTFVAFSVVAAIMAAKVMPRWLRKMDPRTAMILGSAIMGAGFGVFALAASNGASTTLLLT